MPPTGSCQHRILLAAAAALMIAPARAQQPGAEVDFLLRGSGDPVVIGDLSSGNPDGSAPDPGPLDGPSGAEPDASETAQAAADAGGQPAPPAARPLGPAMAGPAPDDPLGPPLLGPQPLTPPPDADAGPPARRQDDPFAAPGIAVGTFIVRPTLDLGILATTNADGGPDGPDRIAALVEANIDAVSDGTDHLVRFEMRGSATGYGDPALDERELDVRLLARRDLAGDTRLEATAGYNLGQTAFTDPDTPGAATERPDVHTLSAGLRAERTGGAITASLAGSVVRTLNEDVALSGGGFADLSGRDSTEWQAEARIAVATRASLSPFLAVAGGRVEYDQPVDPGGFSRARDFAEIRAGIAIDRGPKLSGELSAGYRRDDIADPALADIESLVAEADILWSPVRLTRVRFLATSRTDGSFQPGVSGSRLNAVALSVDRRFRNRLRAAVGAGYEREDFIGLLRTDQTITGYAELQYDVSRYAAIVGRYDYIRTESDDPAAVGTEHRASIRLRVKR